MPHEMAPPQPTPDELAQRLLEEHANTEIQFHGKTMAFGQFVQLRAALCPVKPGELGPASDTEFMVNVLTDSKVELSEEYHSYIRQPESDKPETSLSDIESVKKNDSISKKELAKKAESVSADRKSNQDIREKHDSAIKTPPKIYPEIMARVVQLETKPLLIKPIEAFTEPIARRHKTEIIDAITTLEITPNQVDNGHVIVARPEIINSETVDDIQLIMMPSSEILLDQPDLETAAILAETDSVENKDLSAKVFAYVPTVETEIESKGVDIQEKSMNAESITGNQVERIDSERPVQFEINEEVEKTPAVAVAEFMLQVLPAVTQEVYERVQEMEPEAAAEVVALIETISIVADRLHELVVQGKTEGEEAKQIEAYLKREYEQLLVSVGIEPTEEILNDFIRYVYSAEYQIREEINLKELELIDEGTHEKKLFDEQGVFSRAHAASLNISRRLDKSIGHLVVNYFSS